MLHPVNHDGPVHFFHIYDSLDSQEVRPLEHHDGIKPLLQRVEAQRLVIGHTERADVIVVAVHVMPVPMFVPMVVPMVVSVIMAMMDFILVRSLNAWLNIWLNMEVSLKMAPRW